jgi:Lamin Tail Domain
MSARTPFPFIVLLVAACGEPLNLPEPPSNASPTDAEVMFGTLSLALESPPEDGNYRLGNAHFEIEGPTAATLESDSSDTSKSLSIELEAGSYTVSLLDGWELTDESGAKLAASVRNSRLPFTISADMTTPVEFAFEVDPPPSISSGTLSVSIAVSTRPSQLVVISELMVNPAAVSDAAGEWIELSNLGAAPVDLTGCTLARDGSGVTLDGAAVVPAGGTLTLAAGPSPGFVPNVVYGSLSLPNSSGFTLSLVCGTETLDSVTVVAGQWPIANGASLSLSGAALDPSANDLPENWCLGTLPYATDLGSPGSLNPPC